MRDQTTPPAGNWNELIAQLREQLRERDEIIRQVVTALAAKEEAHQREHVRQLTEMLAERGGAHPGIEEALRREGVTLPTRAAIAHDPGGPTGPGGR